jgi:hypothetical protein
LLFENSSGISLFPLKNDDMNLSGNWGLFDHLDPECSQNFRVSASIKTHCTKWKKIIIIPVNVQRNETVHSAVDWPQFSRNDGAGHICFHKT